jgi:esterase/lipase superfamily enzyme
MFIVTNREVDESQSTPELAFGSRPNSKGPNELRLAWAERKGTSKSWHIQLLPDEISDAMATEVGLPLPSQTKEKTFASRYVARKLQRAVNPASQGAKGSGRNVLFFVHGFNNDVPAVLDRAESLANTYGVEVVPFSWPANGGGVKGVASYKSDKRDALASVGALDRAIARLAELLKELHADHVARTEAEAFKRHGDNAEKWDRFFSAQAHKWCPFRVNMMLHSMGNYVFKHLLKSSSYRGDALVFDNVVMVAADTNHASHAEWVDRIECRGRIFVTINERDSALAASRMKLGEQQRARLGHTSHGLNASKAVYVDFTDQSHVSDSHAYFEGKPLRNAAVKTFFHQALNGEFAEAGLPFDSARNLYRLG